MSKLILGKYTPEEAHAAFAFGNNKCACGRTPITRCITLAPLDEAMRHFPQVALLAASDIEAVAKQVVRIKENPTDQKGKAYVRIGIAYACQSCRPILEKEAAKLPSWCIAEFNHGPGTKVQV